MQNIQFNYAAIKQIAKDAGISIKDLCALAPKNDPFYCGSKGQTAKGTWFAQFWKDFNYTEGVHLRRVHYQLVSQQPAPMRPDGKPYENTLASWAYLLEAGKAARYLGLVQVTAFVDRRNPDPILHTAYRQNEEPGWRVNRWRTFDFDLPRWPGLPEIDTQGYNADQPYHLEIWVEKTTMNDVLLPLCRRYDINLITGAGELSITAANNALQRIQNANVPAVIFYIADFDPAGYGMPVSIARKMEYLRQSFYDLPTITLHPIALTADQVRYFDLPRTPIKATELRKAKFEQVFGSGAVELDAIEALYPGRLATITEKEILRYYDPDLNLAHQHALEAFTTALEWEKALCMIPYANDIARIQEDFEDAVNDFEDTISPIATELPEIIAKIEDSLTYIDIDLFAHPQPEPEPADEYTDPLYDSDRHYLTQLEAYQHYRQGG